MKLFSSWYLYAIIALVVAGTAAGAFFIFRPQKTAVVSPEAQVLATPTPVPFELTTWNDEAGFTIQYPKDLKVNKHEEDPDNYAHLELTSDAYPGKIIVWVKDLPAGVTTLESWVKKFYSEGTVMDTKLGGEPAKKIITTAPVRMQTTGTISEDLLFYVEATLTDKDYWQRVNDTITDSFAFADAASATAPQAGGSADTGADEEEILQ